MLASLILLLKGGNATVRDMPSELPPQNRGLPTVTDAPCTDCGVCEEACPTQAVQVKDGVSVDRGACIACGICTAVCPTGTLKADRNPRVAVRRREDLVQRQEPRQVSEPPPRPIFAKSFAYREVSTGDNATDLEVAASNNPIFDASRFGISNVASPRMADALVVTGPVGRAMQDPLRRCYDAMAEPRVVIAAGASAISGGLHRGTYAGANGVDAILPVDVYIPGHPPHPWMLLHGMRLAMGVDPPH